LEISKFIKRSGFLIVAHRNKSFATDQNVLNEIARFRHPLGAYEIADSISKQIAPVSVNQVYRALDRLLKNSHIRRVLSVKGFVRSAVERGPILLCTVCGECEIIDDSQTILVLREICEQRAFRPDDFYVEIVGQCQNCR